jgi:hypothetical protein
MRYRLRTLLMIVTLGPPLVALACWTWTSIDWRTWLRPSAADRKYEWDAAKSRSDGSPRELAGVRHAELRYQREDEFARKESVLYRVFVPSVP